MRRFHFHVSSPLISSISFFQELKLLLSSEDLCLFIQGVQVFKIFKNFKIWGFYLALKDPLWTFPLQDLVYCWPSREEIYIEEIIIFSIDVLLYPWHHDGIMVDLLQRVEIPYIPNLKSTIHLHTKYFQIRVSRKVNPNIYLVFLSFKFTFLNND